MAPVLGEKGQYAFRCMDQPTGILHKDFQDLVSWNSELDRNTRLLMATEAVHQGRVEAKTQSAQSEHETLNLRVLCSSPRLGDTCGTNNKIPESDIGIQPKNQKSKTDRPLEKFYLYQGWAILRRFKPLSSHFIFPLVLGLRCNSLALGLKV